MDFTITGHGLYYVTRDGRGIRLLEAPGHEVPEIPRPERDVVISVLRYVVEELEKQAHPLKKVLG